jgi:tRNA pseudouridine55 synthase
MVPVIRGRRPDTVNANQQPETSDQAQLNGIIVINKPAQITSAGVVASVKRISNANKVGHTGTLDPMAEGVLICCLNRATRLARFLLQGNKKYEAVLKLGEETDTQDATGTLVSSADSTNLSQGMIRSAIARFVGPLEQLPPVYSALKHNGVPLYRHARQGKPVQKPPRQVHIFSVQILNIEMPFIRFEVTCSAGTYIRTLCADIGTTLGCGGHLHALWRLESCGFTIQQALTLEQLEESARAGRLTRRVITMADALKLMPGITADADMIARIRHGRELAPEEISHTRQPRQNNALQPYFKIVDSDNNLIAVIEYQKLKNKLDYCCVFAN